MSSSKPVSAKPVSDHSENKTTAAPQPTHSKDTIIHYPSGVVERVFRIEGNSRGSAYKDDGLVEICCGSAARPAARASARSGHADEQDPTRRYRYMSLISGGMHGQPYVCHPSKGKDTWVVVVDSGFETDVFPHEFKTAGRAVRIARPAPDILYGEKVWNNKVDYVCFDEIKDRWSIVTEDKSETLVGHGTTVAMIAGGSRIGVATQANLLLYKVGAAYWNNVGTETDPVASSITRHAIRYQACIHCLEDLIAQLDAGELPKGKTVLNFSFYYRARANESASKRQRRLGFWQDVSELLRQLSSRGVTIVTGAGNRHVNNEDKDWIGRTTRDYMPPCLTRDNKSIMVVGGVDGDGRLWWVSGPGTEDCEVHVYAQAHMVDIHDLQFLDAVTCAHGTSYAAPQVAGLAAYFLGHPEHSKGLAYSEEDHDEDQVGVRVKKLIADLAWEWHEGEDIKCKEHLEDYPTEGIDPTEVAVAFNNYDRES